MGGIGFLSRASRRLVRQGRSVTLAFNGEPPDDGCMVGRYGTQVWVDCECGQRHVLLEAEVGELVAPDAPRTWRVVVPLLDAGRASGLYRSVVRSHPRPRASQDASPLPSLAGKRVAERQPASCRGTWRGVRRGDCHMARVVTVTWRGNSRRGVIPNARVPKTFLRDFTTARPSATTGTNITCIIGSDQSTPERGQPAAQPARFANATRWPAPRRRRASSVASGMPRRCASATYSAS